MLTAGERVKRTVQYYQTSASESSSFSFNGGGLIHHQWLIGTDRITIPERERERERGSGEDQIVAVSQVAARDRMVTKCSVASPKQRLKVRRP